jgi:hypothetical protein
MKLETQWIVGFVDGEGCFHVGIARHEDMRTGYQILPEFTVVQHERDVQILLDEDEIDEAIGDPAGIMATPEYRACFGDLAEKAGKYLTPQ